MKVNHITGKLVNDQLLITTNEAHRISTLIDKLEEENARLREALVEIEDGNFTDFEVGCECPGHARKAVAKIDSNKETKCPSCTVPCGNEWCCFSNPNKPGK